MRFRASLLVLGTAFLAATAAADCPQLLSNSEFTSGVVSPWVVKSNYAGATYSASVSADAYKTLNVTVYAASEPLLEDIEVGQHVSLVAGETYKVSFWIRSTVSGTPGRVKVGNASTPYQSYGLDKTFTMTSASAGTTFTYTFTATETDANAGFVLFFGEYDTTVTLDSIFIEQTSSPACNSGGTGGTGGGVGTGGAASGGAVGTGGAATGGAGTGGTGGVVITGATIHANQVTYVPAAEKRATVVHPSVGPLPWELLDAGNTVVASGTTTANALDTVTGDTVHVIDFSSIETAGTGYRLRVGNTTSLPFAIGGDSYGDLRRDALRFFYHQRASSAITAPYAEGAQWQRAAGHLDTSVPCLSGCSYSLNVSKGWYDAGDHGKYVVNGGIATWTLMNVYERAQHLGTTLGALGDSTLNIPESGNGVSDLLDEVRWEMDFLLSMQVPDGQALAGMAHHKIHDDEWTALPMAPAADTEARYLHAPSTAATLNLAATAAQCARVFESSDPTYAAKCLAAAKKAYSAAKAHPAIYASPSDTMGGGAYDDTNVTDELYWAAAELFATTGEATYLSDLTASPHHLAFPEGGAPFSWPTTAGLGMVTLATVPSELTADALNDVRLSVVQAAVRFEEAAQGAYGSAMGAYGWGSNSDVLNAGIVLGLAYDLTGSARYRAAALSALDHVLGRNPLRQSYVTGYGASPFENAHHRFWANAFDLSYPKPPPGVIAGGPNVNLDGLSAGDPLTGCKQSKCWRDDAAAFGLTEVTVNWNAPLAWLTAWASEQEVNPKTTFPGVDGTPRGTGGSGSGSGGSGSGAESGSGDGGSDGGGNGNGAAGDPNGNAAGSKSDDEIIGSGVSNGGCACSSAGDTATRTSLWASLALPLLWVVRRRRRAEV